MIKLKTDINLPEFPVKLSYRHQAMMMGSCFTENIGNVLRELLFPIEINPFGTLYNPFSIANSLEILWKEEFLPKKIYFMPMDYGTVFIITAGIPILTWSNV
jgi:hypothetical protein